jgi:hypothetical protein
LVPLGRRRFEYLGAIVALELDLIVLAMNHFGSLSRRHRGTCATLPVRSGAESAVGVTACAPRFASLNLPDVRFRNAETSRRDGYKLDTLEGANFGRLFRRQFMARPMGASVKLIVGRCAPSKMARIYASGIAAGVPGMMLWCRRFTMRQLAHIAVRAVKPFESAKLAVAAAADHERP